MLEMLRQYAKLDEYNSYITLLIKS